MNKKSNLIIILTLCISLFSCNNKLSDDEKIRSVISSYEKALNSNNVKDVLLQFTTDGILVIQGSPTSIGAAAIEKFYTSIFEIIDFDLKFKIEEIVQMSTEWAFVRTTTGSNNPSDSGKSGHEIFILRKQADGIWKIARYAGSSAK